MIDLKEIIAANGVTVLMMGYLLICRRKNRESTQTKDKIYDGMVLINLLGALLETISFLVDGKNISAGRFINYLSNSLCFSGTVSIGFLWCLYVDLHIYQNRKKTFRKVKIIMIPWAVEIMALVCNLFGTGIMFTVSEKNIYHREAGAVIGYCTLMIYYVYSICLVYGSKIQKLRLHFFPVLYFVIPCLAGVILQFAFYGITASYISVAVALIFVQMQTYAQNVYVDELSGLFNRRHLNGVLAKNENTARGSLYGIMMDVNDFKSINDTFGHNVGDSAIRRMGEVLLESMPNGGIVIRCAGDEFIALLPDVDEAGVRSVTEEINSNLKQFNRSGAEPFALSVSMGYAKFEPDDNIETFQRKMDEEMYKEKRRYHLAKQNNGEENVLY